MKPQTDNQKNPNPIGDNYVSKPEPLKSQEVRPPTLPEIKKRAGITIQCDYYDNKFGRS
jgi:hypothetical protein